MICSAFHSEPKYGIANPKRARIHVFKDEENDIFLPIFAGPYTDVECNSRQTVVVNDREYDACVFCRASCPAKTNFKEPDAPDIPLKCDMCAEEPPLSEPMCVKWCLSDALTCIEVEEKEEGE